MQFQDLHLHLSSRICSFQGSDERRAFLNVIDIDSEQVLAGIVDTLPERDAHNVLAHSLDMQGAPVQPRTVTSQQALAAESNVTLRRSLEDTTKGPDRVTSHLLLGGVGSEI